MLIMYDYIYHCLSLIKAPCFSAISQFYYSRLTPHPNMQHFFIKLSSSMIELLDSKSSLIFNCDRGQKLSTFSPRHPDVIASIVSESAGKHEVLNGCLILSQRNCQAYIHSLKILFPMDAHHSSPAPILKFHDHELTITGMTPCKDPQRFSILPNYVPSHSTLTSEAACEELLMRPQYKMNSRILKHTQVTERMRAVKSVILQKLRVFLMGECAKQWFFRETCVLACTLADLYFLHQGSVQVQELQSMVIGCLIIACKMRQGTFPFISEQVFHRQELLNYEKRVLITLNFNLNPPTYYTYAQRIVFLWDKYTEQQRIYNFKFAHQTKGVNIKLRRFYQHLDCIFMALESLDFDVEELVVNLFYLHARMLNVYEIQSPHLLTDQQFERFFYPKNDNFFHFYSKFLGAHCKREGMVVDGCVGCFLKPFLSFDGDGGAVTEWVLEDTKQHYQAIRVWDQVQTLPADCYHTVKNILNVMKNRSL